MFITWNDDKHSIGIPEIDNQHQELFLITNQLFEEGGKPPSERRLIALFKRLYAYTKYHFGSEEEIFRNFSFPRHREHHDQHNLFTGKIRDYLEDYREKPNTPIDEPLDFLVRWIIEHIQGADRGYAEFFQSKGIRPVVHFAASGKKTIGEDALRVWKEQKLQLEIADIDKQHKELVYILQQANDLLRAEDKRRRLFLPGVIRKMFYYSQYHFAYEEELMSRRRFPETLEHRKIHNDFILRVQDFAREYKLGKASLNEEIVVFLKDWTLSHILKEDAAYKGYVTPENAF